MRERWSRRTARSSSSGARADGQQSGLCSRLPTGGRECCRETDRGVTLRGGVGSGGVRRRADRCRRDDTPRVRRIARPRGCPAGGAPGRGGCRPDDPWPGLVAGLGSHSVSSGCAVSCSRSPSPGVGCSTPRSSGPTRPVESGPVNWSTWSRGSSGCSRVPTRCCSGSARSHSCSGGSPRRTTRAPRADTHSSARRQAGYPHPARARPRRVSGASRTAARPRTVRGAPRHRNGVTATARATGPTVSTPGGPKRGHVSGGPGDGPLQRPG
ncbi:MAG: hypothetical protein ACI9K3_000797 [Halovenus sp.]